MTESERQKASSEYYSELKKQLDELLKKDTELLKISEKIRNNKANFEDTAKYSEIVSNYIAKVIQDNVGNISSPMGKEYVCKELLNSYYSSINDVLGKVQVSVDSKNNIHIRPQQAPVPTERIEQIAHSLEDTTVSEDVIKRRSGSPVANVAKSFHDDFIQKNATFRNKAGLKCYITRHSSGNCCKWCSSIAGKYLYKDAPHDVFRRHDNCNCTVTYENGKQRQNVWSKEKWQAKETPKEEYKPVKLNHEQAKAIQQNNLNYSNSLVKDKQAKMREFIKQTGQDRDYFREQNYPKSNNSIKLNTSLKPDNKKVKDNILHTEYRWDSKINLEKAKENVKKHSLVERIENVRKKIRNNGLQEKYIHEAGRAMFEELMVIYDKSNKNKGLYTRLKKQFDEELSNGTINMEIFRELESMPVIENHELTLKKILSKVRNVGYNLNEINNHLIGMNKISFEIVSQAYQYLPEDWIKSSLQKGKIVVKYDKRGKYENYINTLSTNDKLQNAIHELIHRMEYTHSGLLQAEKVFYKRRTENEKLTKLSDIYPDLAYKDFEVTKKDKFIDAYMGKDYNGKAYELLTMGLETLYSNPEKIWKDSDMTTWLYGVLILL